MPGRIFIQDFAANGLAATALPLLSLGMCYEFDAAKDLLNRRNHRYSLAGGEDLLRRLTVPGAFSPPVVALEAPGRDDGERRFRVLFLDHESQLVDFVYTVRGAIGNWIDEYRMRAISYRRAYEAELFAFFEAQVSLAECLNWMRRCIREGLARDLVAWPLTETVEEARRTFLARPARIFRLAEQLAEHVSASVVGGDPLEPAEDPDAGGFSRISLNLDPTSDVGRHITDYLFNGSRGLRYYFAVAPVIGALVSKRLTEIFMPVVQRVLENFTPEQQGLAMRSLGGASAKLWPDEGGLDLQAAADAAAAIALPLWQRNCERWRADPGDASFLACWGMQAPFPARLQIKGAFVDQAGNEWIAPQKDGRADQIYRWGWS